MATESEIEDIRITAEQLGRMYTALSMLADVYISDKISDEWICLLAEGPLEEVRRLIAQLDDMTGRDQFIKLAESRTSPNKDRSKK